MFEVLEKRYNFDTTSMQPTTPLDLNILYWDVPRDLSPDTTRLFYKICSAFLMELFISSSSFFFHIVALLAYQVLLRCMPRFEKDQQSSSTGYVSDNSIIRRFPYNVVDTAIVNSILLLEQLNLDHSNLVLCCYLLSHNHNQQYHHSDLVCRNASTGNTNGHNVLFTQARNRPHCGVCRNLSITYCEACKLALCCCRSENCFYTYHNSKAAQDQFWEMNAKTKASSWFIGCVVILSLTG